MTIRVLLKDPGMTNDQFVEAMEDPSNHNHGRAMAFAKRMFKPYEPGDPLRFAIEFDVDELAAKNGVHVTDHGLLETVFAEFNIGDGPLARRYRGAGNRSLSVGDVVVIDGRPYSCEVAGWKPTPDLTLDVAHGGDWNVQQLRDTLADLLDDSDTPMIGEEVKRVTPFTEDVPGDSIEVEMLDGTTFAITVKGDV